MDQGSFNAGSTSSSGTAATFDIEEPVASVDVGEEAVEAVVKGSKDSSDLSNALDWFLSDDDAGVRATKTFEINVGADEERWVKWTVGAISREEIRQIRRSATPNRQRLQGGEVDDMKANLGIAVAGTISPDLAFAAAEVGTQDRAGMLKARFAHKPGLIDQIAGEVIGVSGYDDDDVRDVAAVRG